MNPSPPGELPDSPSGDYRLATTPNFERAFRKLDEPVAERVREKLRQLVARPQALGESLHHLSTKLVGLHKCRVGDYRVLFWVDHSQRLITLYTVKHRSVVYKQL